MTDSVITITKGGVTYSGPDATRYFQARSLLACMKLTAKTGLLPRRGFTKTVMLQRVAQLTMKDYRLRDFDKAIADLNEWVLAMAAALPVERK
jgi:hypothetical protein